MRTHVESEDVCDIREGHDAATLEIEIYLLNSVRHAVVLTQNKTRLDGLWMRFPRQCNVKLGSLTVA
jgi:hypothetical protein